jgi:hypothetical protein
LRYELIANNFVKYKVWQDDMIEKVGQRISVKGRDFPSLWGALNHSVNSAEAELQEAMVKLRKITDPISKDKPRLDQDMVDWKAAVLKGFQDVGELLDSKFEDIDS